MKKLSFIFSAILWVFEIFGSATTAYGMQAPSHSETRYETGISTSFTLLGMSDSDLESRLTDIKSLGTTWIRVDFSWNTIQPDGPREYNWRGYDRVVAAATKHQLKVLALIGYAPPWAREPRCKALVKNEEMAQKCNPRSSEEFGGFARAAVLRYSDKSVRGWEIWNEPNLNAFWKTTQSDNSTFVDPIAYARFANAAAYQIRQHTDAVIITGGLSPLFEPSRSTGMRQSEYLAKLLPHLDHNLFTGVSIHPYTWPLLPTRAVSYNAFHTVDNGSPKYNLRTVMNSAGWGDKQIWGTEFGASTKGKRLQATRHLRPDHVTEAVQAQIIAQGVGEWYDKSNVGPLFVHSDSDQWLHNNKTEGGFGLRRDDGTKKPAYDALKQATQQIRDP